MGDTTPPRYMGEKPPPRWFIKAFTRINVWVYRLSGGRLMGSFSGYPICLVTMTGARSGRQRIVPLMYVPHGETIILVASQGGNPKHPVWYYNLVAHPEIVVEQGGRRLQLKARLVDADEKDWLWPICVEHYDPYETYQMRTTRDIPVFICEPNV